jgi:hypothetical protein
VRPGRPLFVDGRVSRIKRPAAYASPGEPSPGLFSFKVPNLKTTIVKNIYKNKVFARWRTKHDLFITFHLFSNLFISTTKSHIYRDVVGAISTFLVDASLQSVKQSTQNMICSVKSTSH